MAAPRFDVARAPSSPPLPEAGIAAIVDRDATGAVMLRGSFRVRLDVLGDASRPIQRHLVIVARLDHRPVAVMPFREHLLFAADDSDSDGRVQGHFNVALRDAFPDVFRAGRWSCHVSLGPVLSNQLAFEIA